jgi:hypothetical protein
MSDRKEGHWVKNDEERVAIAERVDRGGPVPGTAESGRGFPT